MPDAERLAREERERGLRLDQIGTPARKERATAALKRLRAEQGRLLRAERHGEAQHDG